MKNRFNVDSELDLLHVLLAGLSSLSFGSDFVAKEIRVKNYGRFGLQPRLLAIEEIAKFLLELMPHKNRIDSQFIPYFNLQGVFQIHIQFKNKIQSFLYKLNF